MQDDQDYYTILGVSRDASVVDIRRAYRALAKSLHPDSLSAGSQTPPAHDFRAVTEAYETLKDEGRRRDYDEELNSARQLASRGRQEKKPGRAFAAGLTIGILVAVGAIGAKIYLDRAGSRASVAKSQDSLRARKADQVVSANVPARDAPSEPKDDTPLEAREAMAEPPAENPIEPAESPSAKTLSPGPVNPGASPSYGSPEMAVPAGTTERMAQAPAPSRPPGRVDFSEFLPHARFGTGQGIDLEGAPARVSGGSPHTSDQPAKALQSRPAPLPETAGRPSPPPLSAFTEAVLSLEKTINTERDGVAAYRLVSLVGSATRMDDLSQAVGVASKPETRELINSRIETLKRSQNEPVNADARPEQLTNAGDRPAPFLDNASTLRFPESGVIEVAAGSKARETILHLLPGNGLTFTDCASCPEMVVIPAGQSVMGSRPENESYRSEEAPAHRIFIRRPLAISKHGISLGNWRLCVEAGACRPTEASLLAVGPHIPATRVSWFDAKAYADWLSQTTGWRYRLLSEAEWEYVARAGAARESMETALRPNRAIAESIRDIGSLPFRAHLRRAGGAVENAWGIHAMNENVLEWVEDCWHGSYEKAPADASAWLSAGNGDCAYRVVRGTTGTRGAFGGRRAASRAREFADMRAPTLGFRVAREIPAPTKTALDGRAQNIFDGK